uniref:Replitron C-terminal domain-containing protein n=1 Tax=Hemiselmis tepida TaxID=464990 RepID=A0A7S0V9Q3_9CRYP|mmetsp:Transcript_13148/g.33724  ORF Transcript_13148/g.33724 Transcript_13148/m.33724 type:complete len:175 (+) Transcript_13148:99-623(+)
MLNKELSYALGWYGDGKPQRGRIMCRVLKQEGVHTWDGMLGYVFKYHGHPDFLNFSIGVSDDDIERGRDLYSRLGAGDFKHRTALSAKNVILRAAMFWQIQLRANDAEAALDGVLTKMINSSKFYPAAGWVAPYQGAGMDLTRTNALWRATIYPGDATTADIRSIFFRNIEPAE